MIQPSSSLLNETPDPDPTPAAEKQTTIVTTSAPDFAPPQELLAEATSEPSDQPGMTAAEEIPAVQSVSDALEALEVSEASGPKFDNRPHEPSSESEAIPHADVTTNGCSAGNVLKSFRDGVSFHVDDSGWVSLFSSQISLPRIRRHLSRGTVDFCCLCAPLLTSRHAKGPGQ